MFLESRSRLIAFALLLLSWPIVSLGAHCAEVSQSSASQHYQPLDTVIANWLKRPELQNSMVGIEVMELPSGRILYSLNGGKRFVSASTAKLLTTACAYEELGANYSYSTRLYGTGTASDKSLSGDLILQPSQDPTFTRDDTRQMFVSLCQRGINQIDGRFIVATVAGGHDHWATGWLTEDWGQEWMPPSSNFAIDRNIAQGNTSLKGYRNINLGPDTANNAASEALLLAGESAAWIECDPLKHELLFYRSPGMNLGAPLVVANPSTFNYALALTTATEVGVRFANETSKEKTPFILVEHESKPLPQIIQTCLHKSDNFYAQQILRTLGLSRLDQEPEITSGSVRAQSKNQAKYQKKNQNKDQKKSQQNIQQKDLEKDQESYGQKDQQLVQQSLLETRGLARLSSWLGKIGVHASEFVLFDGCGLSRKDGITPHTLNMVLKHMATAGCDGPFLQLMRRYSPVNKSDAWFAYKTGSMDTARSVAGVLETVGGQHCAVTIMVNGHRESVSALKGEIDGLVGILDSIKSIKFISAPSLSTSTKDTKSSPASDAFLTTTGAVGSRHKEATDGQVTLVALSHGSSSNKIRSKAARRSSRRH